MQPSPSLEAAYGMMLNVEPARDDLTIAGSALMSKGSSETAANYDSATKPVTDSKGKGGIVLNGCEQGIRRSLVSKD
ncbi:hypothetical protein M569_00081 [Genlisea aurea]|uniref:Uncharacterized protein n=1 Tax=Genlisea aurea TaxID=192259 RepID=S8DB15_9LAMI|nr:hypothetical protein M569_00081 [Genlisea aurea]